MARMEAANHVARVLSESGAVGDAAQSRIALSWRRCLMDHKLDPARPGPPQTFTESELKRISEPLEELLQIVIPELEDLARVLREAGYCVNFADANGTMLASRLPGGDYEQVFRERNVYTGSNFSEAHEGTNGVGTALADRRPILVHRDDHFRAQHGIFTCGVAPLFDHFGALAGAINITSCRNDLNRAAHQLAFSVAIETARRIENAIFRRTFGAEWTATLAGADGSALIAFDDDRRVVGVCRNGRALLGVTEAMIKAGVDLGALIRFKGLVSRTETSSMELQRADGLPLGRGQIAPPRRAPSPKARPPAEKPGARRVHDLDRLAGGDPGLVKAVRRLALICQHDVPILLNGETGTGKDVFARAIHAASGRSRGAYIALNCAAMPESLIDAELFGYEAGAFTGARREGSKGLIARASGGTLFLDEIGDMPLPLQTRLLRVLENREVWPLGAAKPLAVDIRLISATHRDLAAMASEGRFRADLYYRLRGFQLRLPPLRDRPDKAELIAQVAREEAGDCVISPAAWAILQAYSFPGNLRQLRHLLRVAGCTAENGEIDPADLDLPADAGAGAESEAFERAAILQALRQNGGRVARAASELKLSRATLYRKLKLLKIALPD